MIFLDMLATSWDLYSQQTSALKNGNNRNICLQTKTSMFQPLTVKTKKMEKKKVVLSFSLTSIEKYLSIHAFIVSLFHLIIQNNNPISH